MVAASGVSVVGVKRNLDSVSPAIDLGFYSSKTSVNIQSHTDELNNIDKVIITNDYPEDIGVFSITIGEPILPEEPTPTNPTTPPETKTEEKNVPVIINGKVENAGTETSENAAKKNMSVVLSPVEFSIVANTTSKDGTKSEVTISKFSQYVERVIDIPEGVDPSKITTGVVYNADGSFKPNQKITREEAMAIYAKAMDIAKLDTSNPSKLKAYKDSSKISSWAYDSVDKVVASGIFSGRSASQISPKDNITCAEAVVAMRNLLVKGNLINE